MKIQTGTTYYLPTLEHETDFLEKCEAEGIKWANGDKATANTYWRNEYCIKVWNKKCLTYGSIDIVKKYEPETIFIEWKIEKAKPTIIKLPNGHKFVFNPPYTIYTDGFSTGKAKCNPADGYKAEVGLQIALARYQEAIAMRNFLRLLGRGSK